MKYSVYIYNNRGELTATTSGEATSAQRAALFPMDESTSHCVIKGKKEFRFDRLGNKIKVINSRVFPTYYHKIPSMLIIHNHRWPELTRFDTKKERDIACTQKAIQFADEKNQKIEKVMSKPQSTKKSPSLKLAGDWGHVTSAAKEPPPTNITAFSNAIKDIKNSMPKKTFKPYAEFVIPEGWETHMQTKKPSGAVSVKDTDGFIWNVGS